MFQSGYWFAWYPVKARAFRGERIAWLEDVYRDRVRADTGAGSWRYYTTN